MDAIGSFGRPAPGVLGLPSGGQTLVINVGPVWQPGAAAAHVPPYPDGEIALVDWLGVPTKIIAVTFTGSEGSSIYQSLVDADGKALPRLLSKYGAGKLSDYARVALCGYSAGHNLMAPLLLSDGDSIDACVSIDACFSPTDPPWTKQGYVDFGTKAALGKKLFVLAATGSSHGAPGNPSSTGSECARANFDASVAASGASPVTVALPGLTVAPTETLRAGDLFLLDYAMQDFKNLPHGGNLPHWHIVNSLSRNIFQTYLAPFLANAALPGDVHTGPGGDRADDPPEGPPAEAAPGQSYVPLAAAIAAASVVGYLVLR